MNTIHNGGVTIQYDQGTAWSEITLISGTETTQWTTGYRSPSVALSGKEQIQVVGTVVFFVLEILAVIWILRWGYQKLGTGIQQLYRNHGKRVFRLDRQVHPVPHHVSGAIK